MEICAEQKKRNIQEAFHHDEFDERRSEPDGAIWFISLLTRVDVLVLLNSQFEVPGYRVRKCPGEVLPCLSMAKVHYRPGLSPGLPWALKTLESTNRYVR